MGITIRAKYIPKITKSRGWYIASCKEIDVHSQGKTERQARANLKDAVSLFIQSCVSRGVFREAMILHKFDERPYATPSTGEKPVTVEVPIHMLFEQENQGHAAKEEVPTP